MRSVIILGSTGSIGTQTLDVIKKYSDKLYVKGLCCDKNIELLEKQIEEFKPEFVVVRNKDKANELKNKLNINIQYGDKSIIELASKKCDIVLNALVGLAGLEPTIAAIKAHNDVALANKETLVGGGDIVMPLAKKYGVNILPVDSEHSAIWQCKNFNATKKVNKIFLTASGGAFRDLTKEEIEHTKAVNALKHPTWNMGKKVTIDSATLVNKGLEIIEAMHLFQISAEDIQVIIHPQSIVHSMIMYDDGSITAQLSYPDMKLPITLALLYPERGNYNFSPLDLTDLILNFKAPDLDRFPCLKIAIYCAKKKGVYPIIFNAANEILVPLYLNDKIKFYDFNKYIQLAIDKLGTNQKIDNVEIIYEYDKKTRDFIKSLF